MNICFHSNFAGNGRPFALEVEDALEMPTEEKLQQVVAAIAAREGLNSSGDVEVVMLKKVLNSSRFDHFFLINVVA